MKIGEFSLLTGVSVRMLRYYEQEGLIHPAREPSGYRNYSAEEANRVKSMVLLNRAGLPLSVIRDVISCVPQIAPATPLCDVLQAKIRQHMAQIDQQLDVLTDSRQRLAGLLREGGQ